MKQRLLQETFRLTVKLLLRLLTGTVLVVKGLRFCVIGFGRYLKTMLRVTIPGVLFLYLTGRKIKRGAAAIVVPMRVRRVYAFGNRYFVHALVVALVLFAAAPSLRAADAPTGVFGEGTLLKELVDDENEEIIIDDLLPSDELASYLEARFQNQQFPPVEEEKGLPLTLEGGALINQDLPGTTVPLTRTEVVKYTVEGGDTIWAIAEKFGVSVATVLWANNLSLYSTIRPGQELIVLPISGVQHIVKKGDTLGAIAKRYGASADEILEVNNLDKETSLAVGATLVIPGGRPYVPPQPAAVRRREIVVPPSIAAAPGGGLLWPTNSRRITQYFRWSHTGLDIGNKTGAPIYAAENGIVEFSGWGRGGWGNTVLVSHGAGLKTRYAHATKVLVEAGQQVNKGDVIALVGSTGRSTGPHLHLGVYVNGRAVNPLEYVR